jgi:hypothetical protein
MKMANGKGNSGNFFENTFDVNTFFDNGLYMFTQFEYSVPPLLGSTSNGIDEILNMIYAQYSNDNYDLTIGNLYLLQGMGLSLHTFQNQNIDYDNSINGIDINYHLNDRFDIFSSIGYSNVKSRSNPAESEPSISIKNNVGIFGTRFFHDNFELHYLTMAYNQLYDSSDLLSIDNSGSISEIDGVTSGTEIGIYLDEFTEYIISENPDYEMNNLEHNIGLSFMIGPVDFYLEKSLVYYNKLLSERTDGYKNYMSIYANLLGFDVLYEYKDYSTTLLYNVFSNPPIVFKEASSALIGRNLHTVDFSNEYGHQIDINRIFHNDLTLLISYAFALHYREGYEDKNIFNFNIYDDVSLLNDLFPYEQYFIEFSNWSKNGKLYYRIGNDYYYEVISEKEKIEAKTIPMQYAYKFKGGNSLTLYAEWQDKYVEKLDYSYYHDFIYLSPSYNHFGKWSLTFFSDIETYITTLDPSSDIEDNNPDLGKPLDNNTYAVDFTVNIDNSQLSLFFGSQKGGLVCANGSCVLQPDFEDGLKVTFRTSF